MFGPTYRPAKSTAGYAPCARYAPCTVVHIRSPVSSNLIMNGTLAHINTKHHSFFFFFPFHFWLSVFHFSPLFEGGGEARRPPVSTPAWSLYQCLHDTALAIDLLDQKIFPFSYMGGFPFSLFLSFLFSLLSFPSLPSFPFFFFLF